MSAGDCNGRTSGRGVGGSHVVAWPSRLSIRSQLLVLVLGLTVPATAFFAWHFAATYREATAAADVKLNILAANVTSSLEDMLEDNEQVLGRLAERPLVKALDPRHCDPILGLYIEARPEYSTLAVRDAKGNIVCTRLSNPPPANSVREAPWFKSALRWGRFTVSDASERAVPPGWVSISAFPIRDGGSAVSGFVFFSIDLISLNRHLFQAMPQGAVIEVVDRNGRFLLRSTEASQWIGRNASRLFGVGAEAPAYFAEEGVDHVRRLYASATVPGTGWRVFAGLPEDEVLAGPRAELARGIGIGLAVLALMLLLAWRIGRSIVRPVLELARTSKQIAAGEEGVRADESGPRELRRVAAEFNRMLDIQQRDREQRAALAAHYNNLFRLARDVILLFDPEDRVVEVNDAATEVYGYNREEWRKLRVRDLRARGPDAAMGAKREAAGRMEGALFEAEHRRKDGTVFAVEVSTRPLQIEGKTYRQSVIRDISSRKQAEAALLERESRYRTMVRSSMDGFWILDRDGRILDVNERYAKRSGYSREELLKMTIYDLDATHSLREVKANLATVEQNEVRIFEVRHRAKDGSVWPVELSTLFLPDEGGRFCSFLRDITERKRDEQARRQSEERYRRLFEGSIDAVLITVPDGGVVAANSAACRMFQRSDEEICKLGRRGLIDVSDVRLQPALEERARTGKVRAELAMLRKDGTRFPADVSAALYREPDGQQLCAMVVRDLSERRKAEFLLQTRLRLSELANSAPVEQLLQEAVDAAETVTGSSIGFFHFVDPGQESLTLQAWSTNTKANMCSAEGAGLHYPIRDAGVWVDCFHQRKPVVHNDYASLAHKRGMPVGHAKLVRELVVPVMRDGMVTEILGVGNKATDYDAADIEAMQQIGSMVQDILDRRRAEDRVRKLSRAVEQSPASIVITDRDGRIEYINPHFCEVTGYTVEEAVGQNPRIIKSGQTPDEVYAVLWSTISAGKQWRGELCNRKKSGELFWEYAAISGLTGEDGLVSHFIAVKNDITAQKEAHELLAESEQRFRTMFNGSPVGIVISRLSDGTLLEANEAALRLIEYQRDEVIGRTVAERSGYSPEERQLLVDELERNGQVDSFHVHIRKKSGAAGIISVSARVITIGQERCMVAMLVDATERKKLEEIHLQSQKLESLGTLAGGIAHDFNNILTAIRGNAALATRDVGPDHPAMVSLAEISKAGLRASELVRRIMAFGRPHQPHQQPADLASVVEEVLRLLRSTLPAGIALTRHFHEGVPAALVDTAQVHEAVVNLTTNAAQAIGRRAGVIEYEVDFAEVGGQECDRLQLPAGRYVRLSVRDNGCGINDATRSRIFDAFFTTKPPGEGTGLGLSMVYGIMQSHGGAVGVESAPGKGARFTLYFPADKRAGIREGDSASRESPALQPMRILFVDDEEALVSLARRGLALFGHNVRGFVDPAAAIEAFCADPAAFDIVVTDLSMPLLSGFDMIRQLRALRPDIPIVLTTGYLSPEDERVARELGVRDLLSKPITIEEFVEVFGRIGQARRASAA